MASLVTSLYRVLSLLMMMVLLDDVLGTKIYREISVPARGKRQAGSQQMRPINEQLLNGLREPAATTTTTTIVDPNFLQYTPSTPSPEQVNCYVEVPVTRRVGGRCVLLGSRTWGCQAGLYLSINSACQNESMLQTGGQARGGSVNSNRGRPRTRNLSRRRGTSPQP